MLQRIRSHTQGWMAWVLLIVLAFVFALWGISGELISNPGEKEVTKVAGTPVTEAEVRTVYERLAQQSQMAQIMAGVQTPIINEESMRKQALDSIVIEKVLTHAATSQGFKVTPEQVNGILVQLPQFQVNGQFSATQYERVIRQMNFTPESFHNTVLNEMLITQAQSTIRDSAFVLPYQLEQAVALVNQKRDIKYAVFNANTFAHEVHLTPEDLEAYYNGHQSEFMTDESVMVAYVEVNKNDVAQKVKQTMRPTDAQLLQGYEDKIVRFTTPEQRTAKHILVAVKPNATPEEREQAKIKADALMQKLKNGAVFTELAKQNSDDPGSAKMGGDLGAFGRGEMVPEFEEAVFKNKSGDLVGPVKTDFGYHVILIGNIKPAAVQPFNQVKQTILKEWIEDKIVDEFEKCLSDIDQIAFENSDSLDKVSESFHLPIKQMTVAADPEKNVDLLAKNPKVHEASFSEDVLYSHKNSDILRLSPDQAVVLRVVQHQKPSLKPFDSVKAELQKLMTERQALFLAREKANAALDAFNKGENPDELAKQQGFNWVVAQGLTRQNNAGLPVQVSESAFSVPLHGDKPAMVGAELPMQGSALVVITAVHPGVVDPHFAQTVSAEFTSSLEQFLGIRDFNFYVAQAKEKAGVDLKASKKQM